MKGCTIILPTGTRYKVLEGSNPEKVMEAVYLAAAMGSVGSQLCTKHPCGKEVMDAYVQRVDELGNPVSPS